MLCLDHLTVIAPTLAQGVRHVHECLGIQTPYGGVHPEMGTHNHVLRLGDDLYMEVIAIDPDAAAPDGARWFGLGDPNTVQADWDDGRRLRGWVARTDNINEVLDGREALFGTDIGVSRNNKHSRFSLLPDGALPLGGALPSVIDRNGRLPPSARMEDLQAHLVEFVLEHPDPEAVLALYVDLGLDKAPLVRKGERLRYTAKIETPSGTRILH